MVYLPTTNAGKTINEVMEALNTAQHQWNTYATQLGRGYTTAYGNHKDAIDKVSENLRLKAEHAYWVLSLLCVAFAGGLAGGLMAPWVAKAGTEFAKIMVRNKVSSVTANAVQGLVQKGTDIVKPTTAPFKPAVKDPLAYWQDMFGELGICFSDLRDEVEADMRKVDQTNSSADATKAVNSYMDNPLLKNCPMSKNMPNVDLVAREAEVGIWIAWAAGRDIDYWKKAVAGLTIGTFSAADYYDDAVQFEPVVNRLSIISQPAYEAGTMVGRVYGPPPGHNLLPKTLINIPGLAEAGHVIPSLSGANLFLRRVKDVVKLPQHVLPQLDQTSPVYKK